MIVTPVIVTADDTTGALETAAACATVGRPCLVVPHGVAVPAIPGALIVLDLRSRHLPADEAASRLRSVVDTTPGLRGHKIDSTLRGNWPAEVEAIAHAGRTVLMAPAFPAAGRTCMGGVVHVDGVPVHETAFADDPRSPVTTSRPTDRLPGAVSAHDLGAVRAALAEGVRIVVADAVSDADLAALAACVEDRPDIVLVGPAGAITMLVAPAPHGRVPAPLAPLAARALVVSASRHPMAVTQLARLEALGVTVVRPPADATIDDAQGVLSRLADDAHRHLTADPSIATLVVVGGDTAAAVIGDAVVTVEGVLGVGVAVGSLDLPDGRSLRLVTKPGGFGSTGTLVDVLHDVLGPT